jgi:hypothetical protein
MVVLHVLYHGAENILSMKFDRLIHQQHQLGE